MSHFTTLSLEERHRELEDLRRVSVGCADTILACRHCYVTVAVDPEGCPCGRNDWTPLTAVVIELETQLQTLYNSEKRCTGGDNCYDD